MKRRDNLFLVLLALGISGCTLEDPFEGEFCPPNTAEGGALAYINYYGERCYAQDCTSEDDCCGIVDKSLRVNIKKSFDYKGCMAGTAFPRCAQDGDDWFCFNGCSTAGAKLLYRSMY